MKQLFYSCVIKKEDVYLVNFPDFEAGFTDGETLQEAMINAKDLLNALVFSMLKHHQELPEASQNIAAEEGEVLSVVSVWIDPIQEKINNQAIKKTLTIPKWLNDAAEKQEINFSNLLQTALKQELHIL